MTRKLWRYLMFSGSFCGIIGGGLAGVHFVEFGDTKSFVQLGLAIMGTAICISGYIDSLNARVVK